MLETPWTRWAASKKKHGWSCALFYCTRFLSVVLQEKAEMSAAGCWAYLLLTDNGKIISRPIKFRHSQIMKKHYPEDAVILTVACSHNQYYTKRRQGFNAAVEDSAVSPSTVNILKKAFSLSQIFNLFCCVGPWSVEPFRNFRGTVCSLAYKGTRHPVEY